MDEKVGASINPPESVANTAPKSTSEKPTRREFGKLAVGTLGALAAASLLPEPANAQTQVELPPSVVKPVPGYEPRDVDPHDDPPPPVPTRKEDRPEARVPENLKDAVQSQAGLARPLINKYPNRNLEIKPQYLDGPHTTVHAWNETVTHQGMKLIANPTLEFFYSESDPVSEKAVKLKTGKEIGRLVIRSYDQYLTEEFSKIVFQELGVSLADVKSGKITAEKMARLQEFDPLFDLGNYQPDAKRTGTENLNGMEEDWLSSIYTLWLNEPNLAVKLKEMQSAGSETAEVNIFLRGLTLFTGVLPVGSPLKSAGISSDKIEDVLKLTKDRKLQDNLTDIIKRR